MSETSNNESRLSRARIFAIGSVATVVLSGLILVCVPEKPAVIANSAKPQQLQTEPAAVSTSAPTGPSELRSGPTGKVVYQRFCAGCHGADGRGETMMARMMSSRPPNLAEGAWKGPQTREGVIDIVRNGRGAMPAYEKEISNEAELNSLADYVLSLRKTGEVQ